MTNAADSTRSKKHTNNYIGKIDELAKNKEHEIMSV
jgi:ribosome recycling factor